jgi:murein endopeptidase
MRLLSLVVVLPSVVLGAVAAAALGGDSGARSATVPAGGAQAPVTAPEPSVSEPIRWRRSRAVGLPYAGRLVRGVRLPSEGRDFFTWDPVKRRVPNRQWRRWGHDRLIRTLLAVLRRFREAHPEVPRVAVGDLSRPRGGNFGKRFGGLGHRSHQNGLDLDVYYPRLDRRELGPRRVSQVDRALAQELVTLFVKAGAKYVFVGPRVGLRGPRRIVQPLRHHDDHMHVRLRPRRNGR